MALPMRLAIAVVTSSASPTSQPRSVDGDLDALLLGRSRFRSTASWALAPTSTSAGR